MAIHYNSKIVTSGLVLALDAANPKSYPGSGTTWRDLSGNGNTGTLVGGVGYAVTNGGSLTFNGSSQYGTLSNTSNLRPGTGDFTIEAWIYKNGTAGGNTGGVATIYGTGWSGGSPSGAWMLYSYESSGTKVQFAIWSAGIVTSTSSILSNQWYHIVVSRIGTTVSLYINNVLEATATSSANANNSSYPIRVGLYDDGSSGYYGYFNGRISAVRSYVGKGLTAAEVTQNYNALKSRYIAAPSIPTPTLPIFYEQLTYIISGNLTATGNGTTSVDIFKTSGSSAWDNQAYSTTAFSAPCTIEFNKQAAPTDNLASYAMIGWNEDPTTDASYTSLDYTSYPISTNAYAVYHNGTQVQNGGTWDTANKLYVVYGTDGFIRHYNGSTLLYSVNYGAGKTVYVDSSFYSVNSTFGGFSNIKVIRSAWNGVSYV